MDKQAARAPLQYHQPRIHCVAPQVPTIHRYILNVIECSCRRRSNEEQSENLLKGCMNDRRSEKSRYFEQTERSTERFFKINHLFEGLKYIIETQSGEVDRH